jgi:hypothetical protein
MVSALLWSGSATTLRAQFSFGNAGNPTNPLGGGLPNLAGGLGAPGGVGASGGLGASGGSGGIGNMGLGSLAVSPSQYGGAAGAGGQKSDDDSIAIKESFVSFVDSAIPRNIMMMQITAGWRMNEPWRSEYFLAKPQPVGGGGLSSIETSLDYQDISTYLEWAWTPWFSMFANFPYRWLNGEINGNINGFSDINYGFKLCTWSADNLVVTTQARIYQPTANPPLGTEHWTVEPGVLFAYRYGAFLLEGQGRYFVPLGGTDFAGQVAQYGLGISWKQQKKDFWFTPVVECVGWTAITGKTLIASSATSYVIQDAHNQTILNGYFGFRWGYTNMDFYLGYGRAFTGDYWSKDTFRFEMRYIY